MKSKKVKSIEKIACDQVSMISAFARVFLRLGEITTPWATKVGERSAWSLALQMRGPHDEGPSFPVLPFPSFQVTSARPLSKPHPVSSPKLPADGDARVTQG